MQASTFLGSCRTTHKVFALLPVILSPTALHDLANPGRNSHMSALIRGSSSSPGPTPSDCDLSGSNKDRGRVNIHFRIPYYTRWGQSLVLTGAGGLGGMPSSVAPRDTR